jgi:thiol-disulfide isomerase/thioredoxin
MPFTHRLRALFLFATLCLAGIMAHAQPTAAAAPLSLHAQSLGGERFAASERLRGKVTIVFYWSTACAVCRDSLPELRANLAGWRDKPFALVTVNVDRNPADWQAYERILGQTQTPPKGLFAVRQDSTLPAPAKLPLTLLVNAQGQVVARYEGRLAPEAWDGVADLLP